MLRSFLTGNMKAIGDVLHPLEAWGYRLIHVQDPADDVDYTVKSLKEDLRDGVRLAKLYEILAGKPRSLLGLGATCEPPLYISPSNDQQRLSNLSSVLDRFHRIGALPQQGQRMLTRGGLLPLTARDIVDANREVTLGMLWTLVNKSQLPRLLPAPNGLQELRSEIHRLVRIVQRQTRNPKATEGIDAYPGNLRLSLLLKWVQAACRVHGLELGGSFQGAAFNDGRALCYLIATYLPSLVDGDQVFSPTDPKPEDVAVLLDGNEDIELDTLKAKGWCAVYEAKGGKVDSNGYLGSFKDGVRRNFQLVHDAIERLGNVPVGVLGHGSCDLRTGGLDEQSTILFVAHLCRRLLEISKEDRAAATIAAAMRR